MTVLRSRIDSAKVAFLSRVGNGYVYGGMWQPTKLDVGTDCSGLWDSILKIVTGQGDPWQRSTSTESYRYTPIGKSGPFGVVAVRSPSEIPDNAVARLAFHHEGNGGAASHMWGELDGVRMESAGSKGCATGDKAWPINHPYANAWAYLPGPIREDNMIKGLDYAGGRPGGAAIKTAGYQFVVRYLSDGGPTLPGKLLTPAEADDLRAHGIEIVSNWETTATRMLSGFDAGVTDAQLAVAQVLKCGGRKDRPIYFSADWDATEAQQASINDYLRGTAKILGADSVGIYGGYWPVSRALDAGVAKWAWQTEAWSGTNREPRAQLVQRNSLGYVHVGGVECDVNEAHATDYGQWSKADSTATLQQEDNPLAALTAAEQRELLNGVRWIKDQLGPNIWGPASSMGRNSAGQELTLRDGLAAHIASTAVPQAAKVVHAVRPSRRNVDSDGVSPLTSIAAGLLKQAAKGFMDQYQRAVDESDAVSDAADIAEQETLI